jgi:hypothetical protein
MTMTETLENRVLDRILSDIDAMPDPPTSAELVPAIHVLRRWLECQHTDVDVMSMDGLTIAVAAGDRRMELVKAVEEIGDMAEAAKERRQHVQQTTDRICGVVKAALV